MKKFKLNQSGSAHLLLILIVVVLAIAGFAVFRYMQIKDGGANSSSSSNGSAKIKHLGINLDYYDSSTKKAGDIVFKKWDFKSGGMDAIFSEYGRAAADNNTMGAGRLNPQPTFIAPLGTKVHSLVAGTVVNVPKLYSKDYSVHVQPYGSDLIFETEHVQNVTVKTGDKVKAGDIVGEVSDYDAKNLAGLGLFEIGILKGGNPPSHICPFDYLDDSIKAETLKKITALEDAWEKFVSNDKVYNQKSEPTPGCITKDPIEG